MFLRTINIESIASERELEVKNRIILERMARRFLELKRIFLSFIGPLRDKLRIGFLNFYKNIVELEKKSLQKTRPLRSVDLSQEVKAKLELAQQEFSQNKLTEAEEGYIAVISSDPKNIDAYEGLAKIYVANRDYKKARETCRYRLKLLTKKKPVGQANGDTHQLAGCYADLGEIYQLEKKDQLAFNNFQKAAQLEPNNPRFLDLLLKISIMLRNKEAALKTFNALKEADPQNQKLSELEEEINNINNQPLVKS